MSTSGLILPVACYSGFRHVAVDDRFQGRELGHGGVECSLRFMFWEFPKIRDPNRVP